jgi:shikimate 5-dehydrogenase
VARLRASGSVELHLTTDPAEADALVTSAAPGSLLVNATGLGKDSPGSPLTDQVVFPEQAVVWDMNYRGQLEFLDQARRQEAARGLVVADGWRYFLHGWTEVISEVFQLPLGEERFASLDEIAARVTGRDATASVVPGA